MMDRIVAAAEELQADWKARGKWDLSGFTSSPIKFQAKKGQIYCPNIYETPSGEMIRRIEGILKSHGLRLNDWKTKDNSFESGFGGLLSKDKETFWSTVIQLILYVEDG